MKAREFLKVLTDNPEMNIEASLHVKIPESELAKMPYPYPWNTFKLVLDLDDISYSENTICLGACIDPEED